MVNFSNFHEMVSTNPGEHNNEKIKKGQISQFSGIMIYMLKIMLFFSTQAVAEGNFELPNRVKML